MIARNSAILTLLACSLFPAVTSAQEHRHPPVASASTLSAPAQPAASPSAVSPGPSVLLNVSKAPNTVEATLTAEPAQLSLIPGKTTSVYAYNGRTPGPTLEVREGDNVIIHFRNNLTEATTVHWHGLHLPFASDGSPFHPVEPGEQRDYVFTIRPGSAGTYWYHPHPHHQTGSQISKGLYGAVIVRAADDPLAGKVAERILILADNRIRPDGSLDVPVRESIEERIDRENGREGDFIFVSGQLMPTLTIRSGEVQRWRVINASASRVYRLSLSGHTFLHVGSDGGLFERPVEVKEILISGGERLELLVRGTSLPGDKAVLQSLPYDRYIPQTRPANWEQPRDILTLQYSRKAPVRPVVIPAILRPIPVLDTANATARHVMVLSQGLINGKVMDMSRVDVSAKLDATEIWELENLVGMDHPFHLHGFLFQVLDRNGVPETFRSWKDTVNVPKHGTARFIVQYAKYPGKWMFHCHILDHEDHGMMGVLQVQ